MALSIITHGLCGPIEDAIDIITDGFSWRNRAIKETISFLSRMGLEIVSNAPYYPEINDRALIKMTIDQLGTIYPILNILARGGFAEFDADLF